VRLDPNFIDGIERLNSFKRYVVLIWHILNNFFCLLPFLEENIARYDITLV
jgi:hypothetical protein